MNRFAVIRLLRRPCGPLVVATALAWLGPSHAATIITRAVVGGGGATSTGTTVTLRSTVGQALVGAAAGPHVVLGSGWWVPQAGGASDVPADLPLIFRAYPNHPNPFNPRTTLAFDLPAADTHVRLRLYDLHGRLVAALVDGPLPAGRHHLVWNGVDLAGRAVASGVYVSVLESSLGRASGKLTLVR